MTITMKHTANGFSLTELVIVVTLIGILSAIVLPRLLGSKAVSIYTAHKTDRQQIDTQLESYNFNHNIYPTAMTIACWGGDPTYRNYFPDSIPTTCNQGQAWTISEGRMDPHTSHE